MRYQYELLGWSTISAAQRYFAQACALEPRAGLAFEQRAQLESYLRPRVSGLPVVLHLHLRALLAAHEAMDALGPRLRHGRGRRSQDDVLDEELPVVASEAVESRRSDETLSRHHLVHMGKH